MGHFLSHPLQRVSSLAEAQGIVARKAASDALVPYAPVFFDLLGQAVIAVFADGTVREGERIVRCGEPWVVVK